MKSDKKVDRAILLAHWVLSGLGNTRFLKANNKQTIKGERNVR